MNIVVTFEQVDLASIKELRGEYIAGLRCAQEPMLEVLIAGCAYHHVLWRGEPVGYVIIKPEGELVEFHLRQEFWVHGQTVIGQVIAQLDVQAAVVKSFDDLFLSSAIEHQKQVSVMGLLVRDYVPRRLPEVSKISYRKRLATLQDLPAVLEVDQDVFTHPERMRGVIAGKSMIVFRTAAEENPVQIIGFGILRPVTPGSDYIDLGIAVDRPFRNKGYAIYMMRDLVEHCLDRGKIPVAGCAAENLASRRMGERVGLVSRHRLLRLQF